MTEDLHLRLAEAIDPYDRFSLTTAIGALQLVQENMERAVRLHRLAHAVAAAAHGGERPKPTVNRIRTIVQLPALAEALARYEDPFENAFSEAFAVGDERFVIVNGPAEGFPEVLHYLLHALDTLPIVLPVFAADLRLRVVSVLRLVDTSLRRAGIVASIESSHSAAPIIIPAVERFAQLREAVAFQKHELPALGVSVESLSDVTVAPGAVSLDECDLACSFAAPLLDLGDVLVLLQPTATVEALIQMIVSRAVDAGAGATLTRAFHEAVTADVRRSAARLGLEIMSLGDPTEIDGAMQRTGTIRIDGETHATLVITTDTAAAFVPSAEWKAPSTEFAGGAMTLSVYQSLARPAMLESDFTDGALTFGLTAVDLGTLSVLEQGDPLALLKYVRATAKLRETTMLYAPTTLAGYYAYWQSKHSYYVSDEGRPSFINADASGAAELRSVARQILREDRRATYADLVQRDQPQIYNGKHLPLDLRPVDTPHVLPPFRPAMDADQEILVDSLADDLRSRLKLTFGPIPQQKVTSVLNTAVSILYDRFVKEASELASAGLLEDLLLRNEAVIRETIVHRASLPAHRGLYRNDADHAAVANSEIQARLNATGALRFLIEYVIAQPPAGTAPLTLERLDRLQALTAQIIVIASMSDFLQFGLAEFSLSVLPTGRLSFSAAPLRDVGTGYMAAFASTEIGRVGRAISSRAIGDALDDTFLIETLAKPIEVEFGVSLATLRRFFVALVDIATAANDAWLRVIPRSELLVALLGHGISLDAAERLISRFSFGSRPEYLTAPAFARHDIYPWRVERKLSHRRRPLALRDNDSGGQDVLFAGRHVLATWRDLVDQFVVGSFPAETRALEVAKGTITRRRGALFNASVATIFRKVPGSVVEAGVQKVKTARETLRPPGDFDVLVAIPAKRRIFAVECKDIAPGRDVQAQASELKELIVGDSKKKSFLQKQRERVDWLEKHLAEVLEFLGLPAKGHWSVEGVIVTNQVVPTPFIRKASLPILSIEQVQRLIDETGPALTFRRSR